MSEAGNNLREKILASRHNMAQTRAIGKSMLDKSVITKWHGLGVYNEAFFHYWVEERRPVGLLAALRLRRPKVNAELLLHQSEVLRETDRTNYKLTFFSAKRFDIDTTHLERPIALADYCLPHEGWVPAECVITPPQALDEVEGIIANIGL